MEQAFPVVCEVFRDRLSEEMKMKSDQKAAARALGRQHKSQKRGKTILHIISEIIFGVSTIFLLRLKQLYLLCTYTIDWTCTMYSAPFSISQTCLLCVCLCVELCV